MIKLFCFILFIFCHSTIANDTISKIDEVLVEFFGKESTGGVVLIVDKGETIYQKAFGLANLEHQIENDVNHVFPIASLSKQFTAVAILQLYEQGLLSLQDNITMYFPDYQSHDYTITIEHLLTHTSGIQDFTSLPNWESQLRFVKANPDEIIDYFQDQPMNFAPGTNYKYGNSSYVLLGKIIEKVSKMSYQQYLQEHIFQPLEMKHSIIPDTQQIINKRSYGYEKHNNYYTIPRYMDYSQLYSCGGIHSTIGDLGKWYQGLFDGKIISSKTLKKAHQSYTMNNGEQTGYGYGWKIGNILGQKMITHDGNVYGYHSSGNYLLDHDLLVIVISNCSCTNTIHITNKVTAIAANMSYEFNPIEINYQQLYSYPGIYTSKEWGNKVIVMENQKLYFKSKSGELIQLKPYSKDRFFVEGMMYPFHFERDQKNQVKYFVLKNYEKDIKWKLN